MGELLVIDVDASGEIRDLLSQGLRQLDPSLLARWRGLAVDLLARGRDRLAFHHPQGRHWFSIAMTADDTGLHPFVRMKIHEVSPPFGLSRRELQVTTLLAGGFSNEAVSAHLNISKRTVDKHIENIFRKTDRWTRSALAVLAVDAGLIDISLKTAAGPRDVAGAAPAPAASPPARRRGTRSLQRSPILVGMPLPLGGTGQADAQEMLNGAALAIDQINSGGGVLDREVRLEVIDCDITSPMAVRAALHDLAARDVAAITAGYFHADATVFDAAADCKVPFLHAATLESAVRLVRDNPGRYRNVFQTCGSDINYGRGIGRFLAGLVASGAWAPRKRRIALVQPPWPGLDVGLADLMRGLSGREWEIIPCHLPLGPDRDWPGVMAVLERLDPDVIVLAAYLLEDALGFQQAFMRQPLPALVYKLYSPSVPSYREILGRDAEGVIWATTTGVYSDAIAARFQDQYQARYGRRPGRSHAGIAYDRISLLLSAWRQAGSAWRSHAVTDALSAGVFRGVNGAYCFDRSGRVGLSFPDDTPDPSISQAHLVFQIRNGRQKIIAPAPYAESSFQNPPWLRGSEND
ncbi:MAG: ABC transporter substrate-binding protein [Paracoccus sp. (in: a-proteobacteria)]|nr:ABC transporter substrate-binding protein [Paracoccus sp. (in: a-proteobacteria)]